MVPHGENHDSRESKGDFTVSYAAPEIIMGQKYDGVAIDLWSLGATLYTLVVGKCPFRAENQPEL